MVSEVYDDTQGQSLQPRFQNATVIFASDQTSYCILRRVRRQKERHPLGCLSFWVSRPLGEAQNLTRDLTRIACARGKGASKVFAFSIGRKFEPLYRMGNGFGSSQKTLHILIGGSVKIYAQISLQSLRE